MATARAVAPKHIEPLSGENTFFARRTSREISFGMPLSPAELEAQKPNGLYCIPRVVPVRQTSGRILLRGEESGGSGPKVGHYVGYAAVEGHPFHTVQPISALNRNAQHRRVFGTLLVRVEVFRYNETSIHTMISLHAAIQAGPQKKLAECVDARVLFDARFGTLDKTGVAEFISAAGEQYPVPVFLQTAFRQAVAGSRCTACNHIHFDHVRPISISGAILQALHMPGAGPVAAEGPKPVVAEKPAPISAEQVKTVSAEKTKSVPAERK